MMQKSLRFLCSKSTKTVVAKSEGQSDEIPLRAQPNPQSYLKRPAKGALHGPQLRKLGIQNAARIFIR
jgi:hypothetical protein